MGLIYGVPFMSRAVLALYDTFPPCAKFHEITDAYLGRKVERKDW